ncbi:hypothetical protein KCP70_17585 [Salmonella enterica subsp. enterica]|nr:hypothetical protein KCP70_17585 [Salmonella enterica subsp. enterica]
MAGEKRALCATFTGGDSGGRFFWRFRHRCLLILPARPGITLSSIAADTAINQVTRIKNFTNNWAGVDRDFYEGVRRDYADRGD